MSERRRPACLIVEAAVGHKRSAYALIRKAIKRAGLEVESWVTEGEAKSYQLTNARFTVDATDAEFSRLMEVGRALALSEGWERFPVDSYHD